MAVILMALPAPALAQDSRQVLVSTDNKQLDAILAGALNLPVLAAAGVADRPRSQEWRSALAVERQRLMAIVRAQGYLDGTVEISAGPAGMLRLRPVAGRLFRVAGVQLRALDGTPIEGFAEELSARALHYVGRPASSSEIASLTEDVLWEIKRNSYPFAKVTEVAFELDRVEAFVLATITIDTGTPARFGPIEVTGTRSIDPAALRALARFAVGDPYDPALLQAYAASLATIPHVRRVKTEMLEPQEAGLSTVAVSISEEADSARLAYLKWPGVVALCAVLIAVAGRQLTVATSPTGRAALVQAFDIAILVLIIAGVAIVLRRLMFLAFPV